MCTFATTTTTNNSSKQVYLTRKIVNRTKERHNLRQAVSIIEHATDRREQNTNAGWPQENIPLQNYQQNRRAIKACQ